MSAPVIKAEGLCKEYVVGHSEKPAETLRDIINSTLTAPFRRFRKLTGQGQTEDRFWALKDVSFQVQKGEVVGIIGRNGAGKSTLLKILTRITSATKGRIEIRGRVASLLEVGTGFHPELTGRENIYLNGGILGMSRREIDSKFAEIADFSGVEKFLDTPVKRYSSGMAVRLAFAVAAHLDPDILVVDEVLAVGDLGFQQKCLKKMDEVSGRGRTILIVSHNLEAIRGLCERVLVIDRGQLILDGRPEEGISCYQKLLTSQANVREKAVKNRLDRTTGDLRFTDVSCFNGSGELNWQVREGDTVKLRLAYEVLHTVPSLIFVVYLYPAAGREPLTAIREVVSETPVEEGTAGSIDLIFPGIPFRPTEISLYFGLGRIDNRVSYDVIDKNVDLPFLTVTSRSQQPYDRIGLVTVPYEFSATFRAKENKKKTLSEIASSADVAQGS